MGENAGALPKMRGAGAARFKHFPLGDRPPSVSPIGIALRSRHLGIARSQSDREAGGRTLWVLFTNNPTSVAAPRTVVPCSVHPARSSPLKGGRQRGVGLDGRDGSLASLFKPPSLCRFGHHATPPLHGWRRETGDAGKRPARYRPQRGVSLRHLVAGAIPEPPSGDAEKFQVMWRTV